MTIAVQERNLEDRISVLQLEASERKSSERKSSQRKSRSHAPEILLVSAAVLFYAGRLVMASTPQPIKAEAIATLAEGKYQRAHEMLQISLRQEGQSATTYLALATAYEHLDQPTQAFDATTDALKLSSVDTNVWSERASLRLQRGQYKEAIADSEKALSFDADNDQAKEVKAVASKALAR